MIDEGWSRSKTIERSQAANRDVQRMIGEEKIGATGHGGESETIGLETSTFAAEVGSEPRLLRRSQCGRKEKQKRSVRDVHAISFSPPAWSGAGGEPP